jgi:hypothetical protein
MYLEPEFPDLKFIFRVRGFVTYWSMHITTNKLSDCVNVLFRHLVCLNLIW